MSRTPLDLSRPLAALREAAGLSQAAAAEARGVARPSEHQAEGQGARIHLSTLLAVAAAFGIEIEIVAKKKAT